MNALVENGIISEMECGNNFAYIINDSNLFLSTEYKVLQSQEEGCFVKCMKLLYNGKIQFYYLVNGYKSLANMFSSIDADGFMTIMTNGRIPACKLLRSTRITAAWSARPINASIFRSAW